MSKLNQPETVTKDMGFIFDFDGTLFDDFGVAEIIITRLAKEFSLNISEEDIKSIADQVIEAITKATGKLFMIKLFLNFAKRFRIPFFKRIKFLKTTDKIYQDEITKCQFIPGYRKTLQELGKYAKIGLSSNTPEYEIRRRLEDRLDFFDYFDGEKSICTGDMVKNHKPDPEALLKIIARWKLPREKIFMVGDMTSDMEAADSAGCKKIAVLTGFHTKEQLEKYNPDFILESISEIPSILNKIKTLLN